MKKVDEVDQENKALREAGEQKDKEIRQLQADMKALKKRCDAEVGPGRGHIPAGKSCCHNTSR